MEIDTGPVALVTGGGQGIGAAVCDRLAAAAYRIVVADIDGAAAETVAAKVDGTAIEVDVSDPAGTRAAAAHAQERYGRLDLAVLNAGVRADQAPGEPLDLARYRQANGVNVDGVVFGIDAVTPMLAGRGGAIVVTASLAALGPESANPVYALGKSAVLGYVRAMAAPLARQGIRINAICPGFADTAILGITKRFIRKQGFPLLSVDEVADAVLKVLAEADTGQAWTVVPGRAPARFVFPDVPAALGPDGHEVVLRPFLTP